MDADIITLAFIHKLDFRYIIRVNFARVCHFMLWRILFAPQCNAVMQQPWISEHFGITASSCVDLFQPNKRIQRSSNAFTRYELSSSDLWFQVYVYNIISYFFYVKLMIISVLLCLIQQCVMTLYIIMSCCSDVYIITQCPWKGNTNACM